MQQNKKRKVKEMVGTVVSNKMDKTVVVRVSRSNVYPVFGKTVTKFNKFKAHDGKNGAQVGDVVRIRATRPISKEKRWELVGIVRKAE